MLEISGEDIAALADDDLRALVARLCEAEMRRRGLPSSAVTWGGAQEAPDAGIDVRVDLPGGTVVDGFIPRAATGFQVKKPDMQPAQIAAEMRPGGAIRPSIQELADSGGAYIIVSGNGSTSDDALQRRRQAMASAVKDIRGGGGLALDFYDRTRIEIWLREHPGLVPWAREKAGRPITGWQSYGPWANPAEGVGGEYLVDDAPRIRTGTTDGDQGVPATDGINRIRDRLRHARASARLVGLSGVGKTRLAQALFDDRVGAGPLDPTLAIYTNLGDSPDPPPVAMVSRLAADGSRAMVVVDNCPPDLHRRLTAIAASPGSKVSVLTIEYDIREDQPEGTEVFELEPSSITMTEMLVRRRFPMISQVDAQRVAEFSGGNARMAIALASTIQRGESVSGLTDDDLFRRLFHQNHVPDAELLRSAEACALVYSFDGEDTGDQGELALIGSLIGQDAESLYARVAELKRRDLIQARSRWRAVLPHALANRLAKLALQDIPLRSVERRLLTEGSGRIKKSFSRRLGYLHDGVEAQRIITGWLAVGGLLADVADLDELGATILRNVAPVAPEAVLTALERAARNGKWDQLRVRHESLVPLLRSLAYDPALFERCAEMLTAFAVLDDEGTGAGKVLTSLFYIYLSGTHATVEQRVHVMEGLLKSGDVKRQQLGLKALRALLQTSHFVSAYDFQFGSRLRDYGYHPYFQQAQAWYRTVLRSAEAIALSDLPIADPVLATVGRSFRGLWSNAGMFDELEGVSRTILRKTHWRDGWIGARQTLHFDGAEMAGDVRDRLIRLEQELRPKDLVQKVRSIVLPRALGSGVGLEEYEEYDRDAGKAHQRTEALAEKLGEEVALDGAAFRDLLPELVTNSPRLASFGRGLAAGSTAPRATWEALLASFDATPEAQRGTQVLKGFLQKLSSTDAALAGTLLDEAVEHPVLGPHFPELQCAVPIEAEGIDRLRRSLALDIAMIGHFGCLARCRAHEPVSPADLTDLVERIGSKPDGHRVALEVVLCRLLSDKDVKRHHEPEIVEAGRELLAQLRFDQADLREDHKHGILATACLAGEPGEAAAASL